MVTGCHLKIRVFCQLLKEVAFRRILVFYDSLKWDYLEYLCAAQCASSRLVGPVQEIR